MPRISQSLARTAIFCLALLCCASASEKHTKVPNFRTTDLAGNKVSLEDYLGKGVILIDFWATWCKPCIKELPYIQRLHDRYSEKGLQVLAVTIDSPKFQSRVKPFIRGRKFTFPVLMDASQDVFRKLQGKGSIPYVVVLDSQGIIHYSHTGYRPGDEKELERVVLELLAETKTSESEALESPSQSPEEPAG